MKKRLTLILTILVATICFTYGEPSAKGNLSPNQEQAKAQSASGTLNAKGPTGFGPLKIGMTKEAVEALQPAEGVYLSVPMSPSKLNKYDSPKAGVERLDCSLITPLSTEAIETILKFENGQLTEIFLELDKSSNMLERIKNQIAEKYGPGKIEDTRKEEQCIYKNGANFKISSGKISTEWVEEISTTERIKTELSDFSIDHCPDQLNSVFNSKPIIVRSLNIYRINSAEQVKSNNLF